ncbi:MAG: winged helix-turn-helix domain-containing protein [Bryobacteraceae bacterium]
METWTFLTNHGHVLLCIAADPEIRLKDVAEKVGITERATQRIVADLLAAGYVSSEKKGRRRYYQVHSALPLRHPVERHNEIGQLLRFITGSPARERKAAGLKRTVAKPGRHASKRAARPQAG